MRIVGLVIVLLVASLMTADAATGTWVNVNPPASTSFHSIVISNGAVLVGTDKHGIWRSTNQGTSWTKANTGAGASLVDGGAQWSMTTEANTSIVYTTSAEGGRGILKSTDGGTSWTKVFSGFASTTDDVYTVSADPFRAGHVLASFHYYWNGSGPSGLIESNNGGASWTIRQPPSNWGAGNAVWFGNNSDTWIVGSQDDGMWITSNAGANWRQFDTSDLTHGGTEALYRDPVTGTLVVADGIAHILRSTNNGQTWQNISSGLTYGYYETVVSDGVNLYTLPSFPIQNYDTGPWLTKTMLGNDAWHAQGTQKPCQSGFCNGPIQGAFDGNYLYGAHWDAGVWRLQVGAAAPTNTPGVPTPTRTATPIPPTPTSTPAPPTATSTAIPPTPTPSTVQVPAPPSSGCFVLTATDGTIDPTWRPC
jgi:hypothetical protein